MLIIVSPSCYFNSDMFIWEVNRRLWIGLVHHKVLDLVLRTIEEFTGTLPLSVLTEVVSCITI